ncbi:hypothetical protein KIN20_004749 [Parelaphostrongylus tenuis]|uniref:Uncharacterized protein n=1 Tax=Parelaphostrongylus tenuis TaxID=148309 RepID=A0AAD5M152_PARTN|nr:hypothetical protein KIN20_004749 [Parelaphostrongylus tenuis]
MAEFMCDFGSVPAFRPRVPTDRAIIVACKRAARQRIDYMGQGLGLGEIHKDNDKQNNDLFVFLNSNSVAYESRDDHELFSVQTLFSRVAASLTSAIMVYHC